MMFIYLQKPKRGPASVDSLARQSGFKPPHAWEMEVVFDKKEKCWRLSIAPGFINGVDPRFPRAEAEYREKKNNSGTGKPLYSNSGKLVSGVEIGIMDADPAKILEGDWKDILANGPYPKNPDVVPAYFSQLYGIKPPPVISDSQAMNDITSGSSSVVNTLLDYTPPTRLLFKSDVWIEQARSTYKVETDVPGNLVTGDLVDYTVTFDTTALKSGVRPKVSLGPIIPSRTFFDMGAGQQQFNPAYIDSEGNAIGIDFLQIGTIYWLSPDKDTYQGDIKNPNDVSEDGTPTWVVFTRHDLFYNLSYYKKNVIPTNLQQTGLDPFLAFFVGQYTFAGAAAIGVQSSIEQQVINNINNQVDQSGMFWTT